MTHGKDPGGSSAKDGDTRKKGRGRGQRAGAQQQALHSPVLEEEDLTADLSDAIKDNVLLADLRSDRSQRRRGAGASVNVGVRGGA